MERRNSVGASFGNFSASYAKNSMSYEDTS